MNYDKSFPRLPALENENRQWKKERCANSFLASLRNPLNHYLEESPQTSLLSNWWIPEVGTKSGSTGSREMDGIIFTKGIHPDITDTVEEESAPLLDLAIGYEYKIGVLTPSHLLHTLYTKNYIECVINAASKKARAKEVPLRNSKKGNISILEIKSQSIDYFMFWFLADRVSETAAADIEYINTQNKYTIRLSTGRHIPLKFFARTYKDFVYDNIISTYGLQWNHINNLNDEIIQGSKIVTSFEKRAGSKLIGAWDPKELKKF